MFVSIKARKVVYLMQHIMEFLAINFFSSLEDTILRKPRSFYRCFCRSFIITNFRFSVPLKKREVPSFDTKIFLKIYLYLNGLQTPKLEKVLAISIAMAFMRIIPNYHSISDFKAESIRIKNLFKLFVSFLKDLIGCKIIAIDGTKSRAHNSKKLISIKEN
jgi:hypothetical protein